MKTASNSAAKKYDKAPANTVAKIEKGSALGNADPYKSRKVLRPHHPLS
jgi:hypothetical protein